ncbi:MAG TPA: EamA family transporter [Candidatus Limnocylindria bacterium]|nr:EamA family transporter [Candidatus Limnocylindria bacterium]
MELGVLFGLGSAIAFGGGDFAGGYATRRMSGVSVAAGAHTVGLLLVLVLLAFTRPVMPSLGSLAIGAVAGAIGGIGLVVLYRGLSLGSMGIVAALSGVGSVAIPVLAGYALGRGAMTAGQWVGIGLAIGAIGAASGATRAGVRPQAIALGVIAGIGFGLWFLLLDFAAEESETWALVASRSASTTLLGALALGRRQFGGLRSGWPIVIVSGALDVTGNATFVLSRGLVAVGVAAALAGLYPIVTMLLARFVLRESLPRLGLAAVAMAMLGVVLISLG